MNFRNYILSLSFLFIVQSAQSQGTQLLRQPSISADQIVFVYANDLWTCSIDGGDAQRLTSNSGSESNPHFSADGTMIAFSAQYEGNTDVYVVPTEGGNPRRLTWHPSADVVNGWTPEGEVLFRSSREAHPTMRSKFYSVSTDGGLVNTVNIPRVGYGEISSDGKYAAYVPIIAWDDEWRNYRGGQAMPIWIQDLQSGALIATTPQLDKERHLDPVWVGEKVYYLSERDYVSNIWSYDLASKQEEQITFHKRFDIKSIDAYGDDIIYEQGGYLHLKKGSEATQQLAINVNSDMNFAIPRWESANSSRLRNAQISPNGKRAIFEYRGELITVPKKHGSNRNITNTSGVADRDPIWSPKGDKIAWFSDEGGEYKLVLADQYGLVEKRVPIPVGTFYFTPDWSPDGDKIAFTDTDYNIWYVTLETGKVTKVDTDRFAHPNRTMNPVWSPDSRYLAYAKQQISHFKSLYIFDSKDEKVHQIVDGLADIVSPVFDQSGEYIYYLASTDYGLTSGWLDMSSYDPSTSRTLYVTVLHKDGKSPLLPKSDDEEIEEEEEEEKKDEDEKEEKKDDDGDDEEDKVKPIDFEGIIERSIAVADVSGDYMSLERAPENKVMVAESTDDGITVHSYDFEKKKLDVYATGINFFQSTISGSHALYRQGGKWSISSLSGKPDASEDGINTSIKIKVNPKEEYAQIFKEGWRYMRDFLYVDNVHGAPWDKVWEWYSPWIKHVRHRSDLNYVVDIMSGEVAVGHSFVYGGDMPDIERVGIGLLGADFTIENGYYKIEKIYSGEKWNPDVTAPLSQTGIDINEGDYITSVNGVVLTSDKIIYSLFEETAGQQVLLKVRSSVTSEDREVVVVPVSSEYRLRTYNWMEENRKKVDEMSNGQLAYVYVPNTGGGGFTSFNRYYFSQQDKKGVIIDERTNGGGSAADYMIDIMTREPIGFFNSKANDNRPWTTPMAGIWGAKVMIINESAGSGGDLLPYMFKLKKIGPLVGTRTWGGLVGTWDTPAFIDGGGMVAPRGGFFDLDGEWAVEGEGISPDIEVIQDPAKVLSGADPQLEAAITEGLKLLESTTFELLPEPAAPIRSLRPEGWDKER